MRQHPTLANAVVLGIPDAAWGETVAAVVQVAAAASAPTAAELRAFVRGRLSPQKTPTSWYVSDSLPTNALGKLQKFRLRDQITAGELRALTG